jgi:predicted dehydrogenase
MKIAIIGSYGHIGEALAGIAQVGDGELVAAARWGPDDPLGFVGKACRANLPIYDDYRRMLDERRPEMVGVFTPLYRLAEASLEAVGRGCHLLSEKPLATEWDDFHRLRAAVAKARVHVAAMFTMRGSPAFRTIRAAVQQGRIGRAVCAYAQKSYPFATRDDFYKSRRTYGGTIPWQEIHAIDAVAWCTGQDYRRLAAIAGNAAHPSHPGMEDHGGIVAELSGGGSAVINFDYLRPWGQAARPWGDDRLRIAGTEGIIETKDCAATVELLTPDSVELLPLAPPTNVAADFLRALQGQYTMPVTTEESFRMTAVALKARDAQDSGQMLAV